MIRKQFYLMPEQDTALKGLARASGQAQAARAVGLDITHA